MLLSKKHVSWYSKGTEGGGEFRAEINLETNPTTFLHKVHQFLGG